MIEDVFARAVELDVARRAGGDAAAAVVDRDVLRQPAGVALADAAGILQR